MDVRETSRPPGSWSRCDPRSSRQRPTGCGQAHGAAFGRRWLESPQHALQARAYLAQVEGLGNVVVGADFQPGDPVHDGIGSVIMMMPRW